MLDVTAKIQQRRLSRPKLRLSRSLRSEGDGLWKAVGGPGPISVSAIIVRQFTLSGAEHCGHCHIVQIVRDELHCRTSRARHSALDTRPRFAAGEKIL